MIMQKIQLFLLFNKNPHGDTKVIFNLQFWPFYSHTYTAPNKPVLSHFWQTSYCCLPLSRYPTFTHIFNFWNSTNPLRSIFYIKLLPDTLDKWFSPFNSHTSCLCLTTFIFIQDICYLWISMKTPIKERTMPYLYNYISLIMSICNFRVTFQFNELV